MIVLAAVLLVSSLGSFSFTGNAISADEAGNLAKNLLSGDYPGISIDSIEELSGVYQVNLLYQGQIAPFYITKDGKFTVKLNPLDSSTSNTNTGAVDVSEDDDAVLGNPDAPVTIIEFSDYQCVFCRKFWTETLPTIKSQYINAGKVKLVYRDFPIPSLHPMAQISAEAAECVREKGGNAAYFKYHDKVFGEQNVLDSGNKEGPVTRTVTYTEDDLKKWAKDIGYDILNCLTSGKYTAEVQGDIADGNAAGFQGTPGFVIMKSNGSQKIPIGGAESFSTFQQIIEEELSV